jgi:hypothetical protein
LWIRHQYNSLELGERYEVSEEERDPAVLDCLLAGEGVTCEGIDDHLLLYELVSCLSFQEGDGCLGFLGRAGLTAGQQSIPIAAAGNSKVPYPFAPALWDSVVSVSAADPDVAAGIFPEYTNNGEIRMEGQYPFEQPKDPNGRRLTGTSYASPRLAAWAALYLLHGGQTPCDDDDDPDPRPVLGYKIQWDALQGDAQFPSNVNQDLLSAIGAHCSNSPYP